MWRECRDGPLAIKGIPEKEFLKKGIKGIPKKEFLKRNGKEFPGVYKRLRANSFSVCE